MAKSMVLGWKDKPPNWFGTYSLQWDDTSKQVRYLGISFIVNPGLKNMWNWIKVKFDTKIAKWNRHYLSLAGRLQVCQKILSSCSLYYYLVWLFCSFRVKKN